MKRLNASGSQKSKSFEMGDCAAGENDSINLKGHVYYLTVVMLNTCIRSAFHYAEGNTITGSNLSYFSLVVSVVIIFHTGFHASESSFSILLQPESSHHFHSSILDSAKSIL